MSEGETPGDLVERARRSEPRAWAEIYETFGPNLYGFFLRRVKNRATAEDLTSQAFLEALEGVQKFHGDLDGLRAWLFRIGRNNLVDHFRLSQRSELLTADAPADAAAPDDPADTALESLARRRMLQAIEGLSPDQRDVILMRLSGGLTSTEIGKILGKTPGAVRVIQHRATRALAQRLAAKGAPRERRLKK